MNHEIVALFRHLTLGVYVIGVADGAVHDAFTASAVMQASYQPLILAIAINPDHASYPIMRAGRSFAISVLAQDQMELARRFGTSASLGANKMKGISWRSARRGAPILSEALAYFECAVHEDMPAGDHHVVFGHVLDGAVLNPGVAPLKYAETHNLDGSAALYPASF